MRWLVVSVTVLSLLGVGGCGGRKDVQMPPGSRLIMPGEVPVWAACDRGNLIYVAGTGQIQIIPMGCLTGQP